LPEAIIFDRGFLFERHRTGFLQGIKDWGLQLGLPDLYRVGDKEEAAGQLDAALSKHLEGAWDAFSRMSSTSLAASILKDRSNFHQTALAASRFSRLGLRVFLLALTGSLALSYTHSRACLSCGTQFTFRHFLSCAALGADLEPVMREAVNREDWRKVAVLVLSRFQVFIHLHRGGQCEQEETDLFAALNEGDE
jgi:hypothetical protein